VIVWKIRIRRIWSTKSESDRFGCWLRHIPSVWRSILQVFYAVGRRWCTEVFSCIMLNDCLQVTVSHPPVGRLSLLSARPAVTCPAIEHHRPLSGTKLYCLVTEARRCEQLAQGCYAVLPWVGFEPVTCWSHVQRCTRCTTAPVISVINSSRVFVFVTQCRWFHVSRWRAGRPRCGWQSALFSAASKTYVYYHSTDRDILSRWWSRLIQSPDLLNLGL